MMRHILACCTLEMFVQRKADLASWMLVPTLAQALHTRCVDTLAESPTAAILMGPAEVVIGRFRGLHEKVFQVCFADLGRRTRTIGRTRSTTAFCTDGRMRSLLCTHDQCNLVKRFKGCCGGRNQWDLFPT